MSKFKVGDKVIIEGKKGIYTICELERNYADEIYVHFEEDKETAYSLNLIEKYKPKNLIPLIAKELGVEIGEWFEIINKDDYDFNRKFLLEENELYVLDKATEEVIPMKIQDYIVFIKLLYGSCKVKKLPPKPKLTEAERVILENLPKEYKWIARHLYENTINVFYEKPQKRTMGLKVWAAPADNEELYLYNHLFQFIKWEDSEAYNIEELLKGE